ncbi:hypothetical protein, partial [Bradyrhizobium algeriense]|uniref:hypothetical protein n=1 Tax=Bradyrhizobium algeriense TaxID=634784 RepID=UPI001AECA016
RRHPAMIQLLVSPTANEESANNPSVPSIQPAAARGFHGIGRLVVRIPTSLMASHQEIPTNRVGDASKIPLSLVSAIFASKAEIC